jgi:hypothetical protein
MILSLQLEIEDLKRSIVRCIPEIAKLLEHSTGNLNNNFFPGNREEQKDINSAITSKKQMLYQIDHTNLQLTTFAARSGTIQGCQIIIIIIQRLHLIKHVNYSVNNTSS